jgi:hypothetical protein
MFEGSKRINYFKCPLFQKIEAAMGLVFSYLAGTEDINRRLVSVEKIVTTLEKNNTFLSDKLRVLEDAMEKHRLTFQWDERTTLFDPTKVDELQMEDTYDESYMDEDADKCKTQEDADAYDAAHKVYKVRVVHDRRQYKCQFRSKDEFKAFKARFAAWGGKRFSHLAEDY